MKKFQDLKELIAKAEQEAEKFYAKGNMTAGTRLRGNMQEIKALARPEFQKNPEKFYPVETFAKIGFTRAQCPKC